MNIIVTISTMAKLDIDHTELSENKLFYLSHC